MTAARGSPAGRAAGRRQPARPKGGRRPPARPPRARLRRAARGDRPYALALLGLLAVILAMAAGPLQNYTAAADRVEALESTRDQLRVEVDTLEERRERLHDPEEIENIARTQFGLVRPGEIPFIVVTPDEDDGQVGPEPPADDGSPDAPWYRRLGRWLADLAEGGGG